VDDQIRRGDRVHLRLPRPEDRTAFEAAWHASGELHAPWRDLEDPASEFARLVAASSTERPLFVVRNHDGALAGVYTLSQIAHGRFRNAYLGYAAYEPHAGCGYMREAMPLLVDHAFRDLGLHRLQANVQPGNVRSLALLRATGWREEGLALHYLMIGGAWRDHVMFAITVEDVHERRSP
jgi:[ribosomal protein S5]-alanine N-acetyltransferase